MRSRGMAITLIVVLLALFAALAFVAAFRYMRNRISVFTALPVASLDKAALGTKLREIGRSEGATSPRPDVA